MSNSLKILSSNVYVANRRLKDYRSSICRHNADAILTSEAQHLGTLPGYHRHGAPVSAGKYARDTAVYLRDGIKIDHEAWYTLTANVGGYAHARTVSEVRFEFEGFRWALFAVHANPGRRGKAKKQNSILIKKLSDKMKLAKASGYEPVASGDFNRSARSKGLDTPRALASNIGGTAHMVGVDGIVTAASASVSKLPKPPGSDHPAVLATLTPTSLKSSETTKVVGSNSFKLASINALGHSHTVADGNNKRHGPSKLRTALLALVLTARRFTVVGLQEFQRPQQKVFLAKLNRLWDIHAIDDNAVVWLTAKWELVDHGFVTIPYFRGNPRQMPWVILRLRGTSKRVAFLSSHNPANVRGDAKKWREEGWAIEGAWARVMADRPDINAAIVVGDKNARKDTYLPSVKREGGLPAGIPSVWGIDWIVGWGDIAFTEHHTAKTKRISRMSDHPVEMATAVI